MPSLHLGRSVHGVLLLTPLALVLAAEPACAQRGGCMQRQMSTRNTLQSYALPQQTSLQSQPFNSSQALQQAALQAQLSALQSNAFMAQLSGLPQVNAAQLQLNALQQNALALQLSGQLTAGQLQAMRRQQTSLTRDLRSTQSEALQLELETLQTTIAVQQAEGNLIPAQLRAMRRQVSAVKKQLRALGTQSGS